MATPAARGGGCSSFSAANAAGDSSSSMRAQKTLARRRNASTLVVPESAARSLQSANPSSGIRSLVDSVSTPARTSVSTASIGRSAAA